MSSENSKLDLFEAAKEEVKRLKAEKEAKGNYTPREYDEVVFTGLDYGRTKIIRILGNPKLKRDNDPYSPKDVFISWILGDSDKKFRCIWPDKNIMPSWILWKIHDKVMEYKWDSTLNGGKGGRVYLNSDKHKALVTRIAKNNDVDNNLEGGWYPKMSVLVNIIDREEMEWHRLNKHTRLLSKKLNVENSGFSDPGIPNALYNKIWDGVVEHYGNWKNYDIAVAKVKTGPKPSDVDYTAIHCSHIMEIPEDLRKFVIGDPLTDEEASWERYNIDQLYRVSSYQKIKKNLDVFIQSVDKAFGTKYSEELNILVEEEKKTFEENKESAEERKVFKAAKVENSDGDKEEKKLEEKVPARGKKVQEEKPSALFDLKSLDKKVYTGLDSLTDDMKSMIIGVKKNEKGEEVLVYDPEAGKLLRCTKCKFPSPELFDFCPKCNDKF